jgi:hypothetical protein
MKAFRLQPDKRRGVFIVLVLVILAVFAIMGVVIYSTGSTEYSHTMLVAYKLKTDNLAQAVIEEALCVLYDKVNRPVDLDMSDDADGGRAEPPWKAELLEKIVEAAGDSNASTEIGVLLSFDLVELGLLPTTTLLLQEQSCTIEECVIDFEGFRKIWSNKEGFFVKNRGVVFYKDPTGNLDAEDYEYPYPNDYQGYAVIKVKVSYGDGPVKMSRHLSSIHDIKVVNQTPLARRFALCQWYPNPDQNSQTDDLANGGGIKIFPNDTARLFVRGPYVNDTYGKPNGNSNGGDLPADTVNYWEGNWHGWSNIPSSRAGIADPRLFSQMEPDRPESTSGDAPDLSIGGFSIAGGFDPGFVIATGQSWICASQDSNAANAFNCFSVMGDLNEVQTFEGILAKIEEGGETNQSASPAGEWPPEPSDELEDIWVKRIEGGGLYGRTHQVEFKKNKYGFLVYYVHYELNTVNDNYVAPFGCYYMPKVEPSALGAWIGLAVSIIQVVVVVMTWGAATPAVIAMNAAQFVMVNSALDSMVAGFNPSSAGTQSYNSMDPSQAQGYYPSNFRDIPRLTTRWYHSLDDIPSYMQDDPENFPILMDGSLYVHTLNEQRWFNYAGKGTLVSNNAGGADDRRNPVIEGPIMSVSGPVVDHLNLFYMGKSKDAFLGDDMLYVKTAPDNSATFIDGSVFSVQGVAPADDTTSVTIGGNYLCGYFNKSKIPVDTELVVDYNVNYKPEDEDAINAFHDGRWHTASVSFRNAGWYDKRRD